ncbi:MAG: tetratricopeptide repeat protein, partial [Planctomycetota bacterium]|nr:tetratricopeptide repeat protein [Planctomycetota bacterium]
MPDSTNAWTQKAQLHSALKEFEAAGEAYRKSAELAGPSTYQSNNALLGLARVYQNQKDFAKAEEVLKQLLQEKDPQHRWAFPRAFAALAQIYKATEKLDAFLQTKLEEAEQKPDEPSVLLALISIYQAKGDGNKASEYAENLIRLEPSQFPNHQHLVLGNNVPVERRIAILEKLIINEGKLNTTYQYYLTSLFSLYRTANQKEKAEKFAENILSMKQVMPTTLRSIARYFEQSKDFEKAAALYERAAQVARSEREKQGYRAALIRLYQKSGKSDRARKLAEELLDKAEDRHIRVQASRELYQLLAASGDRDAYIKRLEDKVKAAPEDARALQQLSTMMLMGNRHAEAAELFGRLVKLKPDVKDYYPQWAQSLGSAKLHDKAIAAWQRYFKKFPADRQTYMTSLIYAYRAARRLEEVVKHVEEYSKDFPNQTNILGDLARNLQLAGKSDLAIELFESLVQTEKNENNLSYWRQSLLQIYMKRKSYDRAEPLASKLAQTAKQSYQRQQAARSLNTILKATGKLEAWKKELEARVASKPNKADLSLLATSYQSESRHEDAAALHERIVKLESSAENYTQWFQSLNSARKYPELIAAYKTFFKAFPDQRKNHAYSLSNAYRSAGNLEQALVVARELAKSNPSSGLPKVAELLEQMEKHDEAIAAWKEVLKATSNEHQRWQHKSRMVKLLEKQKKVDEALELLRDQIKNAPSEYYIGLARRSYTSLLRKFNMLDAYLKSLEEAVARNPKDAKAIEELAELHQSSRKSAEAAAWYEKLVALRPDKKSYNGWVNALGAINETSAAIRNKKVDALLKAYPAFFKAFPDERKNRLATLVYACRNASREEEAIEFSTQNVSLQPRNAHAHSMHGDTLRHFKKYDRAIASYRKAIELSPKGDKRLWNYKLNIGYALEGQKKFKEAEAVARSLLAETGQSYQKQNVSRFLARVLRAGGGEEKYIAGLEKRINENPKDEEALRQLIAIYPSKGQYKKMPEIYRKLVAVDPTDSNYSNWMYSYGNAADYKGLVDACLEYFKAFPNRKSQHLPRLWDAYRRLGRTQDAIDAAKEYVTLRKGDGNALANAARLYTELKKYEEAESALAEAIKTRKNESSTWNWRYQLAQVCSKRGKHEEAEKLAQELAATATDSYRKRQTGALLTEVFKRSGNISGLIGKLEDQAKANPKDQGILTQLGAIHTANRDYKEAAQVFDKLVTLNPSKNNYYSWTNALSNAGDHLGCAHSLEVFMKKHPDQKVRQISNLVRAYERAKRIDKAIEAARVNVEIDPRDGRSAMQLGDLLRKSSKVDEAVKVYKQTISQTKSKNIRWDLNYRLADTLKDQKKMPEALEVANKLLATARTSSNTSNAKHLLTTILKSSGGLKNYIRTLEKKAAANPKDAQTLAELATLYNDQQQFAQAAATARKLVAISPTASHYQRLIHPLTSLGKHNDLIEVYRELFDKDPKSTRYHLASFIYTCRNVKKTRAAIPLVRQYVKDYPKDFRMLS